jgi:hypothetical protein
MDNASIIDRLNELFEEAILNQPDEEVLEELKLNPDPSFATHLKYIRKLNTQARAKLQKGIFANVKDELDKMISKAGENEFIRTLLAKPEYKLILALHSKYEGTSKSDEEAMVIEKKMLELVKELKAELGNEKNPRQ